MSVHPLGNDFDILLFYFHVVEKENNTEEKLFATKSRWGTKERNLINPVATY